MASLDRPWTNSTHDWRRDDDADHLDAVREAPEMYPPGGVTHLLLEVVANAAEEARALGRRGSCLVRLKPDGSILVADDGRGTDTRLDPEGRPVRKPIMATRDRASSTPRTRRRSETASRAAASRSSPR